jgi:hypothetical protein
VIGKSWYQFPDLIGLKQKTSPLLRSDIGQSRLRGTSSAQGEAAAAGRAGSSLLIEWARRS